MKIIKFAPLFVLAIMLGACADATGVHKFNNQSYMQATSVAPMEVPENVAADTYIEPYYPAPTGAYPAPGSEPISLLPPEMGELLEEPKAETNSKPNSKQEVRGA